MKKALVHDLVKDNFRRDSCKLKQIGDLLVVRNSIKGGINRPI